MGNKMIRVHPEKTFCDRDLFNSEDDNGYKIIGNIQLNADVLTSILSILNVDDILSSRLVCKNWCDIIDSSVWHEKLNQSKLKNVARLRQLPWYYLYNIFKGDYLEKNLLKNPDGVDKFRDWSIIRNLGNRMVIESPPTGTEEPYPRETCFVTSYDEGSKEQIVHLREEGVASYIMDHIKPKIYISEWYAGRWDCLASYYIQVNLLNSTGEIIETFQANEKCGAEFGSRWAQVTHTFENYSQGVRSIRWFHAGHDRQFWAGHYGCKMTGGELKLLIE